MRILCVPDMFSLPFLILSNFVYVFEGDVISGYGYAVVLLIYSTELYIYISIGTSRRSKMPEKTIGPRVRLSLLVAVTQIRGHIAGASPPSPLPFVPCVVIAGRLDPRRPASICAYPR